MLSVRGVFQNGVVRPIQPVEASDGQSVIIILLDEEITDSWPSEEVVFMNCVHCTR